MKTTIMGLLTETMMHPGSGQNHGAIDLPVSREVTTSYPVVVGSSIKGALRDKAFQEKWESRDRIFGEQEQAGAVAVTDARLLLLPVRSLQGHYRWVTCPYLLERWMRDARLAGQSLDLAIPKIDDEKAWVAEETGTLYLEELSFDTDAHPDLIHTWAEAIQPLIGHTSVQQRLVSQLVVVSDHDFAYLARYSLPVQTRNQLDKETKTSKNLWTEEYLPPDTLLYILMMARLGGEAELEEANRYLQNHPYIQIGGNETVGQGWCILSVVGKEGQS